MGTDIQNKINDLPPNPDEQQVELIIEKSLVSKEKKLIIANKNYLTISFYALFVILTAAFLIYLLVNLQHTKDALSNFISIISPFLIAFFIAFMINPMVIKFNHILLNVVKIKKKGLRIFISIFTSYLLVVGGLTVTILYVTPQLIQSISDLISNQSIMYEETYKFFSGIYERYPDLNLEFVVGYIEERLPDLVNQGTQLLSNMIPKLYLFSISLIKMFVNILLSIVISCYMILDKNIIKYNTKRLIYSVMTVESANGFIQTGKECANIFNKFIIGKSIDSLIIGILCFILMSILRLPYSILISVIVGITNMIPYFGPFIGAVPGIIIYLLISPVQCLIFSIMILVLQQFDGLFLGPKILGDTVGLKPLWIIFAITLGGAYAGALGMFLGVPIIAVVTYLLDRFIKKRLEKRNILINRIVDK